VYHQGVEPGEWKNKLPEGPVKIDNYGYFSPERVEYYYQKFLLMKQDNYFCDIQQEEYLDADISEEMIQKTLANVKQITFEVLESCQLQCAYCGYGRFYDNYDPRSNKKLAPGAAKMVLDYFSQLWNSSLNSSHGKLIYVGFYGGESLIGFPFVKEIVEYTKEIELIHNRIAFSMTTNGLLIEKYMDFLVENRFNLFISLDGNEENNSYRVYPTGTPSYEDVIRSVCALKGKYPDYFENHVNFNAVIHSRNSVFEVFHFFKERFDKIPLIGSLNTKGIKESEKNNFWKAYANIEESLYKSEDYAAVEKEMFLNLPNIQDITTFLHHSSDLVVKDYNDLIFDNTERKKIPTGTCIPFSKKVFITANGKIIPCEKIGHQFPLGFVTPDNIHLDPKNIRKTFSSYLKKILAQCTRCYNSDFCIQCIFNLNLEENVPRCKGFMNHEKFSMFIRSYINQLEKTPWKYNKLLKETIVEY
jgi:uncharacterized protein